MDKDDQDLAEVVHRGRDSSWLDRARENRRLRRRRNLGVLAAVTATVLTVGFFINDGARTSGMLDAMGMTCGEFVVDAGTSDEQIFESWDDHADTLNNALQQRPQDHGAFDPDSFRLEAETAAAELGAEPVHALFAGWTSPPRRISAEVIDDSLVLGHHDHVWSMTDRVSVASPQTGQTEWTVVLEHPLWENWQAPERALYGVGVAGDQVLLQTPAVNGDTDLVVRETGDGQGQDCVRFEGDVDPVEVLRDREGAWPAMMNLNLSRLSDTGFVVLHGLDEESGSAMMASEVDIDSHETELKGEYEYGGYPHTPSSLTKAEPLDVETDFSELVIDSVKPLGKTHYLLTWEAGYIVFEKG